MWIKPYIKNQLDNMVGKIYGNWKVIKYVGKDKHSHHSMLCQCLCEKQTFREIDKNNLLNGKTKSCGRCDVKEIKTNDIFGLWTVIKVNNLKTARCRCSCEFKTERDVSINSLRQGTSLSCGCKTTGFQQYEIIGQWKILDYLGHMDGNVMWRCECQCVDKTLKILSTRQITSGYPQSCGCFRRNLFKEVEDYVIGYTKNGEEFIFDLEDLDKVNKFFWFLDKKGYVIASNPKSEKNLILSRYLMNPTDEDIVDHINRNRLDNRKKNLRVCDYTVNNRNRSIGRNNTSGVTGVSFDKSRQKWMAFLKVDNKFINLGRYGTIKEATSKRRYGEIYYHDDVKYYAD